MKFRTEIPVKKSDIQLKYSDSVMFVGSCFSVHIHNQLKRVKFNTISNPFGIVYNPLSLSSQLLRIVNNQQYQESDLHLQNERWFSFDHHSDFSFADKNECLLTINNSIETAHAQLKSAKVLFLTLGSSWVYHLAENNKLVTNCHKFPAKKFGKILATTDQLISSLKHSITSIKSINPNITVVFSVSPVRHLADGFFENQVSKGRLFDAIHQLKSWDDSIRYFSSYELLLDDLRDYRFYNSDLLHPSDDAIQYIWEKFIATFISDSAQTTIAKVEKVIQAANHRAFNPNSTAHQKFISTTLSNIESLNAIVFGGFEKEEQLIKNTEAK